MGNIFDPDIWKFVVMIDAIALKPLADLPAALNPLQNNVPDPQVLPLLDYFVCTYVNGKPIANTIHPRRSPPMLPPQIWNKRSI